VSGTYRLTAMQSRRLLRSNARYVDPTTPAFGNLSPFDLHRAPAFGEHAIFAW
jgi:hypothetical protein